MQSKNGSWIVRKSVNDAPFLNTKMILTLMSCRFCEVIALTEAVCAHGHEHGGFYFTVVEFYRGAADIAVFFVEGEVEHGCFSIKSEKV